MIQFHYLCGVEARDGNRFLVSLLQIIILLKYFLCDIFYKSFIPHELPLLIVIQVQIITDREEYLVIIVSLRNQQVVVVSLARDREVFLRICFPFILFLF